MPNPDGWQRNPDNTWAPPIHAAVQKQWEVPPDIALTIIRDKAVEVRDTANAVVLRMGRLPDGTYGLQLLSGAVVISQLAGSTLDVKDAEGDLRVRIGKDGTDYDVKVYEEDGTNPVKLSTLAFGIEFTQIITEESTTSTDVNGVDLATPGPSVTVSVGPSGRVIVSGGAFTTLADTGATAFINIDRDNRAETHTFVEFRHNFGGSGGSDITRSRLFTGLAQGDHTFRLLYGTSLNTVAASFASRWIMAQPF